MAISLARTPASMSSRIRRAGPPAPPGGAGGARGGGGGGVWCRRVGGAAAGGGGEEAVGEMDDRGRGAVVADQFDDGGAGVTGTEVEEMVGSCASEGGDGMAGVGG